MQLWNDDLSAQLKLAESEAAAVQARAEEACLLADLAEREAQRVKKSEGIFAEDVIDRAVADAEARRAACRAARAAVKESESRIAVARAALERTELKAPFDGVIAELNAELGEVVIPSPPGIPTPPAVDLIEEDCLFVTAPIDEVDAPQVRQGLEVRVTLDAFPGKGFKGRVRRIAPYAIDVEKQARTVDVEVEVVDLAPEERLLPGYSADVEVLLSSRDAVLRLPTEAVLTGGRVLTLQAGVLAERQVKVGISNWQYTELVSGLDEGEEVVVSLERAGVEAGAKAVREEAGSAAAAGS
jgi:HlyD family secretion protein